MSMKDTLTVLFFLICSCFLRGLSSTRLFFTWLIQVHACFNEVFRHSDTEIGYKGKEKWGDGSDD